MPVSDGRVEGVQNGVKTELEIRAEFKRCIMILFWIHI